MESFFSINDCHSIWDVIKFMGLMSIKSFADKITSLVLKKFDHIPTLKELKDLTGKTLSISVVNVSKMKEEKFCPEFTPNLSCVNAVKISCNLPLIFQRIRYKGSFYADGGLLNNVPFDYIREVRKRVLGIVVTGSDFSLDDNTFMGYFYRLIVLTINMLTDIRCKNLKDNVDLIKIEWNNVPLLQFTLESAIKMDMFLAGCKEAEKIDTIELLEVNGWNSESIKTVNKKGQNTLGDKKGKQSIFGDEIRDNEWSDKWENWSDDEKEGEGWGELDLEDDLKED